MAGKARNAEERTDVREQSNGERKQAESAEQSAPTEAIATGERQPGGQAQGGVLTVDLPLVTAQFRAPHLPSREEIGAVTSGVQSWLPSPKSMLFYGGLAVTAAVGVLEWPVAAAIGLGTALASRGEANPAPQAGEDAENHDGQREEPGER